ncbi:Retrovirus-related Pol polyprotein from transposon opus [Araneus ventricosus]|uniref:RNA-directed DNA polymerase n=1 Tax=Araneus ventricosus TaxID=182803 RepID=A0A4Y2HXK9_ARAVE|nr:Retrovirus-related Pol polyprotein from transposon opus [Araneus ventricosus]
MLGDVDTPHNVEHCIETKGPPVFPKARHLNPEKLQFLKQEFWTLMEQGIIRQSESAFASPIHFVKKPNGDSRICRDFRKLKAVTIPDRYPLPHIQDFSHNLVDKIVFSKIDLVKAYHQIPIKTSDIPKTAVITPIGLFEYTKMTFRLRNTAQSFQRFIEQVSRGLDCFAYLDDILVASEDLAKHKVDLEKVFQRLKDYNLKINRDKYVFGQEKIQFLDFQMSPGGVSPLPDRVNALKEYPLPKSVEELRRFLAMINFYHRFLKNATGTQACLHDLVKGKIKRDKTPIIWTDETKEAFQACKELLKNAAMLAYPKHNIPLSLVTDASETVIGAVLQQHIEGGTEPLGFFFQKIKCCRAQIQHV